MRFGNFIKQIWYVIFISRIPHFIWRRNSKTQKRYILYTDTRWIWFTSYVSLIVNSICHLVNIWSASRFHDAYPAFTQPWLNSKQYATLTFHNHNPSYRIQDIVWGPGAKWNQTGAEAFCRSLLDDSSANAIIQECWTNQGETFMEEAYWHCIEDIQVWSDMW